MYVVGDGEDKFNLTPKRGRMGGQVLGLPGAEPPEEVGRAVTLKSQHWPQSVGFSPTLRVCASGSVVPLLRVVGPPAEERALSGVSLISWEREESWTAKHQIG